MRVLARKIPFLLLVVGALVTGILTGYFRLGYDIPIESLFLHHGALMTGSFLGTVILIERVSTLNRSWLYFFPVINALSLLFFIFQQPAIAISCLIVGSAGLAYVFYLINQRSADLPHQVMWIGSLMWLIGNVQLLVFESYAMSIVWWMAFLLLTITGERLELSKFLPVSTRKKLVLIFLLSLFVVSGFISFHAGGQMISGIALSSIGVWLLLFDMVRYSIKRRGIHRYTAICLVLGYFWLLVSGILFFVNGNTYISYDALMHSFFLGFVFSMIFAHAPIILPAVLKLGSNIYHPSLYVWLGLFQLSLLMRILGGLVSNPFIKQVGGMLNGFIILFFLVTMMIIQVRTRSGS